MGLLENEVKVAELLELNGMPRWVAFEERFIVAEREGEVLAAVRYRTEPNGCCWASSSPIRGPESGASR